ncbi:MAG: hypothetical protein EPN82_10225 [Bacteroidetes bacterium]|nr:MAG: hypothetical protein EPN82_10225 [Bacteroidota bacterium]
MRHIILLSILFLVTTHFSQAQSRKDTIKVDYSFWGNSYYIDTTEYSKLKISDIISHHKFSHDLVSSSKLDETLAVISLAGGLLLTVITLADIINYYNYGSGPKIESIYSTAVAATALDLISFVLFSSSKEKFKRAIKSYNKYTIANSTTYNTGFNVNFTLNRIILSYSF